MGDQCDTGPSCRRATIISTYAAAKITLDMKESRSARQEKELLLYFSISIVYKDTPLYEFAMRPSRGVAHEGTYL